MEKALYEVMFELAQFITKMELLNSSKQLLINYYLEADGVDPASKARNAVIRYTQCKNLPTLAEIRQKTVEQLNKLEHLLLKLEYIAQKMQG